MLSKLKVFVPHFTTQWVGVLINDDDEVEIDKPLADLEQGDDMPSLITELKCFKWFGLTIYHGQHAKVHQVEYIFVTDDDEQEGEE